MLKQKLYQHCLDHHSKNLLFFKERDSEILLDLESESKSSAGDKHETGRAMIHLEREKLGEQLKQAEHNLKLLLPLKNTDNLNYYLAVSSPEFILDSKKYYCVSSLSPIGKLLVGKTMGDLIVFNNTTSTIEQIL
jgi:hypothetical protein